VDLTCPLPTATGIVCLEEKEITALVRTGALAFRDGIHERCLFLSEAKF
jgi:hypothetical protein